MTFYDHTCDNSRILPCSYLQPLIHTATIHTHIIFIPVACYAVLSIFPLADLDIVHSFLPDNTLILTEFASWRARRENLIHLFQRAPFHFGHEEEKEADAEDIRRSPDIAILGALHFVN